MTTLRSRFAQFGLTLALVGVFCVTPLLAQTEEKWASKDRRFALGVGFVYARFDTNVKYTDKDSGASFYIDAEGTLGLPETDAVPAVYFAYNIAKRHSLLFSHFQIRREVSFIDGEYDFEGGHVSGSAELRDRTKFFQLSYGYTLFEDDRSRVRLTAGIYGLDMKYTFEAEGQITIGEDTEEGFLNEEASVFAPLPLIGVNFWFGITPKWSLIPKISFVGGKYQDVTAEVLQTSVISRYQFNRSLGMLIGINYFSADVKIDEDLERQEISYGYNGAFLGLHVAF